MNISKTITGLAKCCKARGIFYTIKFVILDLLGNKIRFPIDGHTKELLFWEKQAMGIGDFSDNFQMKVNLDLQFTRYPPEVNKFLKSQKELIGKTPRVLDVGCGPVSLLAYAHHNGVIELTAVDVIADSYTKLLEDYGYEKAILGIKVVESEAEHLADKLPDQKFNLVYCNNALDHTDSPSESLREMVNITETGGYIIISGNVREGTNESWDGIHMHDLFIDKNALFREGKSGVRTRLDDGLPVTTIFSEIISSTPVDKMFIVYEKKH